MASGKWFFWILFLVLSGGLLLGSQGGKAAAFTDTAAITVTPETYAQLDKLDPVAVIDYGAFVWLELSAADMAQVQKAAVPYQLDADFTTLTLGEITFDTRLGGPTLPDGWGSAASAGPDYRLVQFTGPTRVEWLASLEQAGLQIVQYIHPHSYVVWGEAGALSQAAGNSFVRWTGDFAPAYRLLPAWRRLSAAPVTGNALVYRGADVDGVARQLEAIGAAITSRSVLNATWEMMGITLAGDKLPQAAHIAGVYSLQPNPTDGGLRGEMSDQISVGNYDGSNQAFPGYLDYLAQIGYDGSDVIIANVDGGVQDNHPDLVNRLIPCSGTTCGGGATSSHGTHTAGIMAADGVSGTMDGFGFLRGLGQAPGANLVEQVYSPYYTQPGGMLLLMTDSYNNDASLSGNSWGPSGSPLGYDDDTMQVDIGVRDADPNAPGNQPLSFILSFMNGNGGTSTQGTPDEAKNIFTIGSTKMQNANGSQILQIDDLSSNTAHGPALDGRTIPHMVAPGCQVDSTYSGSSYALLCGTSMASPHVSGAVAVFIEYYRSLYGVEPSPALIKAAFLPVSHDLAGHLDADGGTLGHPFDSKQGWGRMNLDAVVNSDLLIQYFDNPMVLDNTGESWSQTLSPADPSQPMKMMLVWTDAPGHGLGGSTPAWNNDLDLVVTYQGNTYYGNRFDANGWSTPGGSADYRNNTEGVFFGPTANGAALVQVVAADINSDGIPNYGDGTDQDFALVCYNCITQPDFTLAASPAARTVCAPANALYDIEVGSVLGYDDPVTLSASGIPGGAAANFSVNPVVPPGNSALTVGVSGAATPGDYTLTVTGTALTSTHSVDVALSVYNAAPGAPTLVTPIGVDQPLVPTFEWTAASQGAVYLLVVRNIATGQTQYAVTSDTSHMFETPLAPYAIYAWSVRAYNPCGAGSFAQFGFFRTQDIPPILLVDDDDNSPNVQSVYTTALDGMGLTYDLWDTNNSDNEPDSATLLQYEVVIWFTGDEFGGAAGPGSAGETALAGFLNAGNCLFLSSQDYLYDRGQTAFMTNYLGLSNGANDSGNYTSVTGQGSVFGGLGPYTLAYPFTDYSDIFIAGSGAELAFVGNNSNGAALDKDNGVYKSTFWGYPWEAISTAAQRQEAMATFLTWCGE